MPKCLEKKIEKIQKNKGKRLTRRHRYSIINFVACGNIRRRTSRCGSIAQLGEHLPYKQGVTGSSPVVPTNGPVVQLVRTLACHARGRGFEPHPGRHKICGFSSSGRAPPCQGGGSEFEPRNPLQTNPLLPVKAREGFFFLYLKIPTNRCFICGLKSAAQLRDNRGIAKSKVAVLAFAAVFFYSLLLVSFHVIIFI